MVKSILRISFLLGVFLVTLSIAFADIAFPTVTEVYFEKDGEPFDGAVEYTVTCYGYTQTPDDFEEKEAGTYTPENVYSYSATCPEYGCSIYEGYYLNYRHIDYCDLEGEANGVSFEIKNYASTPVPDDCDTQNQYDMYDGDNYYKYTDEYNACTDEFGFLDDSCEQYLEIISEDELEMDLNGWPLDVFCKEYFTIPTDGVEDVEDEIFSDVVFSHENYDAIDYVKSEGIVEGYADGTYQPDISINRAEFTKIIVEAVFTEDDINNCTPNKDFPDVSDEWFAKYVCVAGNNDVIDGYPDGTFGPSGFINFVEAAKIIVNAFDYETVDAEVWYEPYVEVLENRYAIPATVSALDKYITRGEMAEMIYRLKENVTDKDSSILLEN